MIRAGVLLAINTSGGKDRAVVRRTILTPQYQATSIAYRAGRRATHAPNNIPPIFHDSVLARACGRTGRRRADCLACAAFLRRDPPVR